MKTGTGGSSGVGFLRQALELTFFPELFAVRTEIGRTENGRTEIGRTEANR
jgi:tryptophan 2,3-dioxygenase